MMTRFLIIDSRFLLILIMHILYMTIPTAKVFDNSPINDLMQRFDVAGELSLVNSTVRESKCCFIYKSVQPVVQSLEKGAVQGADLVEKLKITGSCPWC